MQIYACVHIATLSGYQNTSMESVVHNHTYFNHKIMQVFHLCICK